MLSVWEVSVPCVAAVQGPKARAVSVWTVSWLLGWTAPWDSAEPSVERLGARVVLFWGLALGSGGVAVGGNHREYKTKIKPIKKRPVKVLRSKLDLVDTLGMVLESCLNK